MIYFFFSSRRRHTRYWRDWSSDVCSSDLIKTRVKRPSQRRLNNLKILRSLPLAPSSQRLLLSLSSSLVMSVPMLMLLANKPLNTSISKPSAPSSKASMRGQRRPIALSHSCANSYQPRSRSRSPCCQQLVRRIRHCPQPPHHPRNPRANGLAESHCISTLTRLHITNSQPDRHRPRAVLGLFADVLKMSSADLPVLG